MSFLALNSFSFCYAQSPDAAIKNIDLEINEGEIIVICGQSGSGKSTLLRCMKKEITPAGYSTGRLASGLGGNDIATVLQDPETQLMCGTVIEDLAFIMENLGVSRELMRHSMAETAAFFGLEDLLHRDPNTLSGGQKQLVVLSAALMTKPRLILLDEPVSQLDPIAARNFLDSLKRINAELGVAIVMTEHRLDGCVPFADRLAVMYGGELIRVGETRQVLKRIAEENDPRFTPFIPEIPRVSFYMDRDGDVCLTAKELRGRLPPKASVRLAKDAEGAADGKKLLELKNVFFAYEDSADFILRNLFFEMRRGERVCLMGGNGSGKTTLLRILGGIVKPMSGTRRSEKLRIAYMPQDIRSYFRFESVLEEIEYDADGRKIDEALLSELGLSGLLSRHPLDLSGGEAGKLALYCVLLKNPDLILVDEPTKGMDPCAKRLLSRLLKASLATVICATHDLEFAARFATRCVMLFDGSISISSDPRAFFSQNQYYTTALDKALRPLYRDAILFEDVMELCEKEARLFSRD